jgi:hypothetical protein
MNDLQKDIIHWLKDPVFRDGVLLYQRCPNYNPRLGKRFFSHFQSTFVAANVLAQLEAQIRANLSQLPSKRLYVATPPPIRSVKTTPAQVENTPVPISRLKERARKLHKRQSMLHAQLSVLETEMERYEVAKEIMEDVIPSLDKIYEGLRKYEETGELPPIQPEDNVIREIVSKHNKMLTLRTRLSTLKRLIKNSDGAKRQKYEKEMLSKELEIEELKKELRIDE